MEGQPFLLMVSLIWLLALPVVLARQDMRSHLVRVALLAIPFAFTETMFCPEYWDPPFLWDLQRKIGFGVEDLFFVSGLGVAGLGFPALVLDLSLKERSASAEVRLFSKRFFAGLAGAVLLCFVFVLAVQTGLAAIKSVIGLLLVSCLSVLIARRDLITVSLICFVLGAVAYGAICAAFEVVQPGVFAGYWHMEKLSGFLVAGVPVEELLYGGGTFALACSFYPALFDLEWGKRK